MRLRCANLSKIGLGLFLAFASMSAAKADELRVLVTRAIATVLGEVGAQFEQKTGYQLVVTSDIGAGLLRRINAGEPFDVFTGTPPQIAGLIKEGKVIADTRTNLVRSGIGVEVRAGAPKPDISSVDAFKRTLLGAKSIAYLKEGASGLYLAGLLDRLGIAEAINSKVRRPDADIVSELVAKGEIEIGMVVLTQILTTPGVELVGPLPAEVQSYVSFVAAVGSNSHSPDVARELIRFLTGPVAAPVIKSQGMEPG
ncbi:MAG: molybdate ABC transporter substrate-binding protein [Xanthobacteraceae bacterium]